MAPESFFRVVQLLSILLFSPDVDAICFFEHTLSPQRQQPRNAALIEDGLASDVARGENAGHRLEHAAVVRAFATAPLDASAPTKLTLEPPADLVADRAALVIYLHTTMEILAAARRTLAPMTSPEVGPESTTPP